VKRERERDVSEKEHKISFLCSFRERERSQKSIHAAHKRERLMRFYAF